ncbi:MAG: hypothetical protein EOL90_02140 [Spartobacteria bacterium]|nr:hypothetical protein [Spartobacteria bacterium]
MKTFRFGGWCAVILGAAVLLGATGCEDDEEGNSPDSIAGVWTVTFRNPDWGTVGPNVYRFNQSGNAVSGSYTFDTDRSYTLSGTYEDSTFRGGDSSGWTHVLEFDGASGSGTISGVGGDGNFQIWTADLSR